MNDWNLNHCTLENLVNQVAQLLICWIFEYFVTIKCFKRLPLMSSRSYFVKVCVPLLRNFDSRREIWTRSLKIRCTRRIPTPATAMPVKEARCALLLVVPVGEPQHRWCRGDSLTANLLATHLNNPYLWANLFAHRRRIVNDNDMLIPPLIYSNYFKKHIAYQSMIIALFNRHFQSFLVEPFKTKPIFKQQFFKMYQHAKIKAGVWRRHPLFCSINLVIK